MKKKVAKYKKGDQIHSSLTPNTLLTISENPIHNGITWMYSFDDTDMRCGEDYLTKPEFIKQ